METVRVAFYRPTDPNEPLINRITSYLTGKFVHVELVFWDDRTKKQNLASSVWQNETVFFKRKTFGRTSWSFKSIQLPVKQVAAMKNFCQECATKSIPFNKMGLIRCVTPFPRPTCHTTYFCSEYVVVAFQKAGLFKTAIPSIVTPSNLWDMLDKMNQMSDASPLMQERINQKGLNFSLHHKSSAARAAAPRRNQDPSRKVKKNWRSFSER